MATNRADTLDPALLRPGRLDRKIEFPMPDRRQKRLVFQVCSGKHPSLEQAALWPRQLQLFSHCHCTTRPTGQESGCALTGLLMTSAMMASLRR